MLLSAAFFTLALGVAGVMALGRCDSTISPKSDGTTPELRDCRPKIAYPGALPQKPRIDGSFQAFALDLVGRHPTELTIAVGLDMRTARPLFIVSRRGEEAARLDLPTATQPRYPMASLAKIMTSAAALEAGLNPDTSISFRGKPHTLYKSQIKSNGRGTEVTLKQAFALSINPVFASLGVQKLGRAGILRWADSIGFNRPKGLGNGVPSGILQPPSDTFNLAEVSSGFVRTTFLSPVHAAMIVRKFAHDGVLRPPAWDPPAVDSLCEDSDIPDGPPYDGLSQLFQRTIDSGTARGGFHSAWPEEAREGFEMGGKTGSLDGTDPVGHYEWFAGYARIAGEPDSGIAVAVMTVNSGKHVLNASWTAGTLLYYWARHNDELDEKPIDALSDLGPYRAAYNEDDQDALNEHPWHRPWKKKRAGGHHRKKKRK